ncbi:hypothetical protein HGRIS_011845 [Hohenbuehelia grisea]|uniref:DUF7729 domain-containing protein n=1 Tax=Hohenbuehelia grisea TaxID=104357 RepID=A0ABR3JWI3_9AGAR
MFTPPPSPHRPKSSEATRYDVAELEAAALFTNPTRPADEKTEDSAATPCSSSSSSTKRRVGRRTKWTAILIPLALILITASTRYITHPVAFDNLFAPQSRDFMSPLPSSSQQHSSWLDPHVHWKWHKRHPANDGEPSSGTPLATPPPTGGSPSVTTGAAATAQPLPSVPSTAPTLPTPFPQAFNSDVSANFTSVSCYNFFVEMINKAEFRSCRPFSLLLQSSDAFLQAQTNLTFLNTVIWGTCNTNTTAAQCDTNMAGFATTLRSQCSADLADKNARAVSTLVALNAYSLMRKTGCTVDTSTNSYCFVNAVHNRNPSDLYYYQLPLGIPLAKGSTPTCSACTKNLMSIYADALTPPDSPSAQSLTGLLKTYTSAAQSAVSVCGSAYATLGVVNAAGPSVQSAPVVVLIAAIMALSSVLV